MTTHSSILAWRIPWTEEPGGLQSMGLQRFVHDWATKHKHSTRLISPKLLCSSPHPRLSSEIVLLTACMHACLLSLSVVFDTLQPQAQSPYPSKNTGVGCHFLLLGIFPTQVSNPCLLNLQVDSLPLCHLGNPNTSYYLLIIRIKFQYTSST